MEKATITTQGEMLAVKSPYNPSLVDEIKGLAGRKWDGPNKLWLVPAKFDLELREIVRRYFPIEGEENLSALQPEWVVCRAVITASASSKRSYSGGVKVDGFSLVNYQHGNLRMKSPGYEITDYSGGVTDGNTYIRPGNRANAYKVQYEITIRCRKDAEWESFSHGGFGGSYRFIGEAVPAAMVQGPASTDIEIEETVMVVAASTDIELGD